MPIEYRLDQADREAPLGANAFEVGPMTSRSRHFGAMAENYS